MNRPPKPLFHILMHLGKLLESRMSEELSSAGVHHGQALVLAALRKHGAMTQADLARGMNCSPATLSTMLQPMSRQGWIDRSTDPKTNRAVVVRLTREGTQLAKKADAAWRAVEKVLSRAMPETSIEEFLQSCESLRHALGGEAPTFVPYEERQDR